MQSCVLLMLFLVCAVSPPAAQAASHYHRLWSFGAPGSDDGKQAEAALTEGSKGVLFGATPYGGGSNLGTIFVINKDGSGYRLLHSFGSIPNDGAHPRGELHRSSDGYLYGITSDEGAVFRLGQDGSGYKVLAEIITNSNILLDFFGGLAEGLDGALYGLAFDGGSNDGGAAFKLNKDGSGYTNLHNFRVHTLDGFNPVGTLLRGSDGYFYGATIWSGGGFGSVFRLSPTSYTNMYSFPGGASGADPNPPLMEGSDGALYGTAGDGSYTNGTVFKINKNGTGFQVVYSFDIARGANPAAGLVEGRDGALYGATWNGGSDNAGVLFRLNKDGSGYSVLHSFSTNGFDGANPEAPLIQGGDGAFYGTTHAGGDYGFGTAFVIWPPETPDVANPVVSNGEVKVDIAGLPGYNYQVMRSVDLTNWLVLSSFTMPVGGSYTYTDSSPPPPASYYRAAWLP